METGKQPNGQRVEEEVPVPAFWLGATGAIPFVACALGAVLAPGDWSELSLIALTYYGALILSFLGGIQWGMAIRSPSHPSGSNWLALRLAISVAPSLIGWVALLLPPPTSVLLLALAFALVLLEDIKLTREGLAPRWYPKLRLPLTVTVATSLVVGAFA